MPKLTKRRAKIFLGLAVPAAAIGTPFLFPTPTKLPDVALGSLGFLHVEETFGVALALVFLVVFAWMAIVEDQLPSKASREGLEYKDTIKTATAQTVQQTDGLQVQVDLLLKRVKRAELSQRELRQLSKQLEALRDDLGVIRAEVVEIYDFVTTS